MKTIGLIGGMSWESTTLYYQVINREVARRMGGLHSARIHVASLNFAEIAAMQKAGQWDEMAGLLADTARKLESAGADCILIGTNTMHKVAPQVQDAIRMPLLHIADAAAEAIRAQGLKKVGLLGTRFTMEQPFYAEHLARHGIETLIPEEADRAEVHRIIFEELCQGKMLDTSRQTLLRIAENLAEQGAEGLILGCTELPLLVDQQHCTLPIFDTTTLHAIAAVDFALQ
ncbi:aspartate/glutamate racemase family protein [Formivibrio citricus]|uniref:aspartate/glutamate racemase family protein n=1 Tax=Formivibrio citricus TaxID=83765 RepID=UPI0015A5687D|nr:aspartate/glutamate racemase family protein [Formivibrio citricus]